MIRNRSPLPEIIQAQGFECKVVEWDATKSVPNVDVDPSHAVVLYGGHPFVRIINHDGRFQPGMLGVNDRTRASVYMSNLPLDWFLNWSGTFMTWAMFKWRLDNLPSSLPWNEMTGKLFIRPDTGFKTFAGTVLNCNKDLALDIKTIEENSSVTGETMIMVRTAVELDGEFRFVIADGKVVAASEYRWDGKLDIRRDWPPECEAMAQKVAEHPWQVDIAYTCDVALLDGDVKLVELNGFSCAGMYACDMEKVVRAVSAAAVKEFNGDDI